MEQQLTLQQLPDGLIACGAIADLMQLLVRYPLLNSKVVTMVCPETKTYVNVRNKAWLYGFMADIQAKVPSLTDTQIYKILSQKIFRGIDATDPQWNTVFVFPHKEAQHSRYFVIQVDDKQTPIVHEYETLHDIPK